MTIPDITIHDSNQLAIAIGDIIKKIFYKPKDYDPYDDAANRLDKYEDSDRYPSDDDDDGDESIAIQDREIKDESDNNNSNKNKNKNKNSN